MNIIRGGLIVSYVDERASIVAAVVCIAYLTCRIIQRIIQKKEIKNEQCRNNKENDD